MTSAAIRKIEQRWQLPFWTLVANLAEQGLSRADSARALGFNPHSFRYHLVAHPELDPFPPVAHPPRDYAADTGESFRDACIRMSATHTVAEAARETGYADSSCFKRARGLDLQFQKRAAKPPAPRVRKLITQEQAEQYAELRLGGLTHVQAGARIGFSGHALRDRLKQLRPDLWAKVKRLGAINSRENRRKLKGTPHIWFSDQQIERLCASYEAGATIDALGIEFGISPTAVRYRLTAAGVRIRRKGPVRQGCNKMLADQIAGLRAKGWTIAQICGKLGMSPTTYYRRVIAPRQAPAQSCP